MQARTTTNFRTCVVSATIVLGAGVSAVVAQGEFAVRDHSQSAHRGCPQDRQGPASEWMALHREVNQFLNGRGSSRASIAKGFQRTSLRQERIPRRDNSHNGSNTSLDDHASPDARVRGNFLDFAKHDVGFWRMSVSCRKPTSLRSPRTASACSHEQAKNLAGSSENQPGLIRQNVRVRFAWEMPVESKQSARRCDPPGIVASAFVLFRRGRQAR